MTSFDIVHLLNHGAYILKKNVATVKESLVQVITSCEMLMPGIPMEKWLRRSPSQLAVRRYGTITLSETILPTMPKLSQFINETLTNPIPASIAEHRGNIMQAIGEANLATFVLA